jgi:hypothetical protein
VLRREPRCVQVGYEDFLAFARDAGWTAKLREATSVERLSAELFRASRHLEETHGQTAKLQYEVRSAGSVARRLIATAHPLVSPGGRSCIGRGRAVGLGREATHAAPDPPAIRHLSETTTRSDPARRGCTAGRGRRI